MLRTKSPPDTASSTITSDSSSPAAHPWAWATKPGSGRRVRGRPASSSAMFSSVAIVSSWDHRRFSRGEGNHGSSGRPSGRRVS